MCDVDDEAVVAAVDAPSIYDIPKVLHSEGLDAYVVRRLGLPFRDVDWTDWDDLLRRVHHPAHEVDDRAGRQVRRPARRLPVGHRGAARRRVRQRRQGQHPLGHLGRLRDTRGRAQSALGDVDGGLRARRLRRPRDRGQARRAALRPREPASRRSACASACSAWSSSTPATSPASPARTPPSSTPRRRTRSSRRWPTSATSSPASATWAARCGSGCTRPMLAEGSIVREVYGAGVRRRAPPAPLRGQQRLPRRSSRTPGCVFSGTSPDGQLVEFVELPREVHPYYVGTQAHPELRSRPTRAAPAVRRAGRCGARRGRPLGRWSTSSRARSRTA